MDVEKAAPETSPNILHHRHNHRDSYAASDAGDATTTDTTPSVEKMFAGKIVPTWRNQLTLRAFVVNLILSVLFTFIVMKLNLTTGVIPSLNVSAGLLGFFFVKTWTKFLEKFGVLKQPFTRQENTVIQTCVVASSGIAFSGLSTSCFKDRVMTKLYLDI
ncbi:probable metal-nicotianamine transporter YSL5 [Chenopodium quinoa]|uniref:probable metal-nicotianamine transporter YSL5 n=1 Tax=Chenopodium quinoa TaxID=63459 RepID=UPI000B778B1C|nr:probable metal-nicotianamine transporter YSL5 [Chenopodium quinoa]